jgi:hypothetical protein
MITNSNRAYFAKVPGCGGSNVALLPPWLPKKWTGKPTTNKHGILQRVKISFEKK